MGVGGNKFCLISKGCGVDDRIRHGQLMANAQFSSRKRNLAIEIGNFPPQSFSDKLVCNRLAPPKKENLSDFEDDYGGNDDMPFGL